MATQEFPMELLEKYLGSLADILGINTVLISYILGALFLLALFVLIRVFSGRRTIKVKLTAPKLPEEASLVPQETLDGLTALYNSTKGALQILKTFQVRKKIGSEMFEKLSSGYRAQLSKIENKFLEEIKSAEHDRLQKVYDKSLKPTTTAADATSTSFPYIDLIPSVDDTLTSSSGPSGAPPIAPTSSSPSFPRSGHPSAPSDGLPFAPPPAPPPTPSRGPGGPPKGPPKGPPPPPPPSERKKK